MADQGGQVRTILTAGDRLDDITRARMWSRIADTIAAPAQQGGPMRWRRTGGLVLGALAAAATLILVVRAIRARGDDHDLTAAPETTLTSRLGPHARASLVGPARLELVGPPGDATAARLHAGTLLAEFEGGPGRSLRIEAGDLVVEIVGTLFAIEVHESAACVAVAHGTVRVTRHGAVQLVTDRQELCSGDPAPHAIPPAVADQLERHARSIVVAMAPPTPAAPERPAPLPVAPPPTQATPPTPMQTAPPARAPAPVPPSTPAAVAAATQRGSSITDAPPPRPATTPPVPPVAPAPRAPSTAAIEVAPAPPPAPRGPAIAASEVAPAPAATPSPPENPAPGAAPRSAEALYHAAELALAAGDHAAADRALAQILALPGGALADQALYERARIAYQDRAWAVARRHLATLATFATTALAEPGRYLDCRIAVEAGDRDAERCFQGYRTAYPRSPHDLDVLAVLVQLAHARAGCAGARTERDELVTRYPRSDHAAAWRSRCPEAP
jgi:hypothetical protein